MGEEVELLALDCTGSGELCLEVLEGEVDLVRSYDETLQSAEPNPSKDS